MKYLGYHSESSLPIRKGDRIIIPAGTRVKTMHPSRNEFTVKRKMTVTVHHTMSGMNISEPEWEKDFRYKFPNAPLIEQKPYANIDYVERIRAVKNPSICWAGSGGYWNEVDINDVLEANGLLKQP